MEKVKWRKTKNIKYIGTNREIKKGKKRSEIREKEEQNEKEREIESKENLRGEREESEIE